MGLSCHVVARGAPDDLRPLADVIAPLLTGLTWGAEPFAIGQGRRLDIATRLDAADPEAAWRDLCQCAALALRISEARPRWTVEVTDDLDLLAQAVGGPVALRGGRAEDDDVDARLRAEIAAAAPDLARALGLVSEIPTGRRFRWTAPDAAAPDAAASPTVATLALDLLTEPDATALPVAVLRGAVAIRAPAEGWEALQARLTARDGDGRAVGETWETWTGDRRGTALRWSVDWRLHARPEDVAGVDVDLEVTARATLPLAPGQLAQRSR